MNFIIIPDFKINRYKIQIMPNEEKAEGFQFYIY